VLEVNDKAPDFNLPSSEMDLRSLSDFRGRWLVLYFYTKDNTPSATTLATDFTEFEGDFDVLGTKIVGISPDECFIHQKFVEKHGITFPLLADPEQEACREYGVTQDVDGSGPKIVRATFVIDGKGVVRHVEYNVNPEGHVRRILKTVAALQKA